MFYPSFYLRRASGVVGAVICRFPLIAYKRRAAFGAPMGKCHCLRHERSFVNIHTYNLRYNLPTLFYIDIIAYMQVIERMKSSLLSVARLTVVPASCTGSMLATGVTAPVRPT